MSMAYQPKSYRKFLAGTVSAAVVASAIAPVASAASFTDVAGSVHADDIATLVAKGYIKGYNDNTFKPNKSLTRGEAAIIFSRILKDAGVKAPEQGAGFPDVPASNAELAEAVAIVKAAGVMGGDEKGNFNPNATITREQMAKVVVEAFKLTKPANHTTKVTDLDKAGAWAREYIQTLEANGVTKNTEFMPKQSVTRGQFASFVVRAMNVGVTAAHITGVTVVDLNTLEVTFNGELKEVKKEDFAIQGVDIESVSIKAAAAAEAKTTVVVIKTKTALEEGKSYSVSYKGQTTDKTKVDVPVFTPKVESVSAINAKTLKVTFNKAVDDTKATIEVKKGSVTASISKVTFAEDKKSVTIELASKLTKGTYTVNVKGLTETPLTGSVDVEDEKVAGIEILSDVAPLVDGADVDTNKDDATVAYKVVNQYGEDITRFTPVSATSSKGTAVVDSVNGKITIDSGTGALEKDDKVTLTLIHAATATTAVKTLTVSDEAKVAEVSLGQLYNKDGKVLNEDTDLTVDKFYIPVYAKDQYGVDVTNPSQLATGLIINETNNTIVDVANTFTEITIDGKKVPALQVNAPAGGIKVGESTITLISNTTGKNASIKITVAEATRTDVVTMSQPEWVVVDEDAYIPVQVTDKQGNLVTDVKTLNDATKGVKVTVGNTPLTDAIVLKDGATFIKVPAANLTTEGPLPVVAVSSSNKVSTLTLNVRVKAVPTVITGLKSDFSKAIAAGGTKTIGVGDLVIEDQYGRVMPTSAVNAWLDAAAANKIVITEDETVGSAVSISDVAGGNDISATGETVTVTAGATNGTEKLTFVLENASGPVQGSSAEATFRVTDGTEYKSYEVKAIGTVYDEVGAGNTDNDAYDKEIEVYGVLNDGSKVKLATSAYTVTSTNSAIATDVADSVIDLTAALAAYAADKDEVVIPVTVTINATGQQFTQDVTFSKVDAKVASVKVVEGTDVDADAITTLEYDISDGGDFTVADLQTATYNIVVTDQYGVSVLTTAGAVAFPDGTNVAAPTLTIVPVEGQMTITNNGLATATVDDASLVDKESFNVTIKYAGGATTTVKVVAKP